MKIDGSLARDIDFEVANLEVPTTSGAPARIPQDVAAWCPRNELCHRLTYLVDGLSIIELVVSIPGSAKFCKSRLVTCLRLRIEREQLSQS